MKIVDRIYQFPLKGEGLGNICCFHVLQWDHLNFVLLCGVSLTKQIIQVFICVMSIESFT